jgi:hypothetical protein
MQTAITTQPMTAVSGARSEVWDRPAPAEGFAQVEHEIPMLSLENAFTDADVGDFLDQINRFLGRKGDEPLSLTACGMTPVGALASDVIGLGSSVVLNTEDGTGTVEGLETLTRGSEVGCDLGMDV